MSSQINSTQLNDILLINREVCSDERGWFSEVFNPNKIKSQSKLDIQFYQDNISFSKKGVLRGLHYQHQYPQGKLITVLQGSVFDVSVDMRNASPTLGAWYGVNLIEERPQSLWIPPGFAHGILTLSDNSLVSYKVTSPWIQSDEVVILWSDPLIGIDWPLQGLSPIVSAKDASGTSFSLAPKFNFYGE